MHVSELSLMRRRNLGNYEHIESSVTISLTEEDSTEKALEQAKEILGNALGLTSGGTGKKAQVKTSTNAAPKKEEPVNTPEPEVKEEAPTKEEKPKTKAKKSKQAKEKVSMEDVKAALQSYAKAKQSKDMAISVMEDVTGVTKLSDVEEKFYSKLIKALAV